MSESQKEPREFWITCKPYDLDPLGQCENVMKYVASYPHEYGVHVREVKPELDAAVEKMRELLGVLAKDMDIPQYARRYCSDELEAYDKAKGLT